MGRVARAKLGLHHGGGYIPIGYNYENSKLAVNPYEAEQVAENLRVVHCWKIFSGDHKSPT